MTEEEQRAKWREASARYRQTAKGRIAVINAKRASKMRDPHKHTARMILGKAVARGHITKPELCVEANSDCNGRREPIILSLTNNQALHLWGIMVAYSHDTRNELITKKVFKKDGTPNEKRKHFSEVEQEKMDNVVLSDLIYKSLEEIVDFSEIEPTQAIQDTGGAED